MTGRCRSLAPPKRVLTQLLLTLAGVVVVTGLLGCGHSAAAPGGDQGAAKTVREYFAGDGARYVEGLIVKNIQVIDQIGGRRLLLTFAGDGSSRSEASFSSLYYMATSEDGWISDLNKSVLSIAWVEMVFDYGDGSSPETLDVNVAARDVAGSTRLRPGPATTSP